MSFSGSAGVSPTPAKQMLAKHPKKLPTREKKMIWDLNYVMKAGIKNMRKMRHR